MKASQLSSEQWSHLRKLAKQDLFFLTYSILGYTKLSVNLHGHLCKWIKDNENARFREILLPRAHYKSTILTISHAIQLALPNDDNGYDVYPNCLGTDIRILLAHETSTSASNLFLGPIANHFLSNTLLMALFPECVPDPNKQRINKLELELPRKAIWGEPTFDTLGMGGRAQGKHYNYLKLDDLIGDKARDSITESNAAKLWFDNIQSLFVDLALDKFDLIGTRWAFDDLYSHANQMYGNDLVCYTRAVEEVNPITGKKEPIFPEKITQESLRILRRNPKVFNSQYLNDPSQSGYGFDIGWLKYYYYINKVKISHFQGLTKEKTIHLINELDIIFLIDPAPDNETGFIVCGTNNRMKTFVLEATKNNWNPPEFVRFLFSKVAQYRPRLVVVEEVLFSKVYKYYWEAEMRLRNVKFRIEGFATHGKAKEERIKALSIPFEKGELVLNEEMKDLIDEYKMFGNVKPDNLHLLDALAQGPGRFRLPSRLGNEDTEVPVQSLRMIDKISGYSKV